MGSSVTVGLYYGFPISGEVDADEIIEELESNDDYHQLDTALYGSHDWLGWIVHIKDTAQVSYQCVKDIDTNKLSQEYSKEVHIQLASAQDLARSAFPKEDWMGEDDDYVGNIAWLIAGGYY